MEDDVYGSGVVFHIEPVADILTFSIDGEGFAVAYIIYKERNQFFRKLVGTVVVRAVGDNGGHSVSVVECADEMVTARFGCAVWAMGGIFSLFGEVFVAERA